MPDTRRHRGAHPRDADLFGPGCLAALRAAAEDLSWLLSRGYSDKAALKLTGDRHRLRERQRRAVLRAACADAARARRGARRMEPAALAGRPLAIDGFNCVIVVESALSGGVLVRGRDRALRDLAGVHGTWRRVQETARAVDLVAGVVARSRAAPVTWYLDRPVSNSGRLRAAILAAAAARGLPWSAVLAPSADQALLDSGDVVASADAAVLDRCGDWVDLPTAVLAALPDAWVVDLAP